MLTCGGGYAASRRRRAGGAAPVRTVFGVGGGKRTAVFHGSSWKQPKSYDGVIMGDLTATAGTKLSL